MTCACCSGEKLRLLLGLLIVAAQRRESENRAARVGVGAGPLLRLCSPWVSAFSSSACAERPSACGLLPRQALLGPL